MGGRGAWSYTRAHFQSSDNLSIKRSKISDYLLNPKKSKGKYTFLKGLGYNMKNQERLQKDILKAVKSAKIRVSEPNKYGTVHIQANIEIGTQKTAKVVTGWIIRKGQTKIEFSTLRPYHGSKDDF